MSQKVIAKILVIKESEQVTEKFIKREFVVEPSGEMYPQKVSFQLAQDKVSLIDGFIPGDEIEISYNLRGREWQKPGTDEIKYFNTLECWRIERAAANSEQPNGPGPSQADQIPTQKAADDDDLPF